METSKMRNMIVFFSLTVEVFSPNLFGEVVARTVSSSRPCIRLESKDPDATPFLTWTGGSGDWSTNEVKWLDTHGVQTAFIPNAPVLFNLINGESGIVTVSAGISAGTVTDLSSGDLTLAGEKIGGDSLFVKGGSGTLALEGKGFDGQEIVITNGVLKLGENLPADALGRPEVPLTVKDGGCLDVNNTKSDPFAPLRTTFDKNIRLLGEGYQGKGLLANNSTNKSYVTFSNVQLLGDATINTKGRMDIRKLTVSGSSKSGQASLVGPTNAVLTLVNPDPFPFELEYDHYFNVMNAPVSLGGIALRKGGGLGLEGSTPVDLPLGITLGHGTMLRCQSYAFPLSAKISVLPGAEATAECISGTANYTGPVRIGEGAVLRLGGSASQIYFGEFSGPGAVEVVSGTHYFCGDFEQQKVSISGGELVYGDQTAEGVGERLPPEVTINGGKFCISPYTNTVYRGMRISGGEFWPGRINSRREASAILEDSTISVGSIMLGTWSYAGRCSFGKGSVVKTGEIVTARLSSSKETLLTIEEGADVVPRRIIFGYYSGSSYPHELRINGGTLTATNNNSEFCRSALHGIVRLNDGIFNLKGGTLRTVLDSGGEDISRADEFFVMNGGTLNLGPEGFSTRRGYPRVPQIYLNGGTLVSTADWSIRRGMHLLFENYPEDPEAERFTLDTADRTVTFETALQGDADVLLKGNGNFNAWSRMTGGLSGHWRIENTGNNDLRNAAAFAGGLSLAPNTRALIRLRDPRRYVSMDFQASDGNGERQRMFRETYPYGWFSGRMHDALTWNMGMERSIFGFSGSFEVLNPGEYTFAMTYDDKISFWIDGEPVGSNPQYNEVGTFSANLTRGWHTFRISAYNERSVAGANIPDWKGENLIIGYRPGSYRGEITPQDLTPFDTDSPDFRMRPSTTLWHRRIADTGITSPDDWDWKTPTGFTSFNIRESIKDLHNPAWGEARRSINEFEGWFRVSREEAGTWHFRGNYDDRIALFIDEELVLETWAWNEWSEADTELSEGFHRFRIRLVDTGGGVANKQSSTLLFSVNGGEERKFDEDSLLLSIAPYGYIGGELALEEGSVLENDAESPCEVAGMLTGTGTLKGKFRLSGATWKIPMRSRSREAQGVRFETPDENGLAEVGKLSFSFDERPLLLRYEVGPALGLPADNPEKLAGLVEVSVPGEPFPYDGMEPVVENGMLILKNLRPGGMTLILD